MDIDERWLMDSAGWPAFKAGRQLFRGGAVAEATYRGDLLRGVITAGKKRRVAGLKINGPTDIENLCQCPQSSREGSICDHSVAIAMAWIEHGDTEASDHSTAETAYRSAERGQAGETGRSSASADDRSALDKSLTPVIVQVEDNFLKIWEKQKFPLRLLAGSADDPRVPDSPESLAACARLSAWLAAAGVDFDTLPPFLVLNPAQAMDFFSAAQGYPWLEFTDGTPLQILDGQGRPRLRLEPIDGSSNGDVRLLLDLDSKGQADPSILHAPDSRGVAQAWIYQQASASFDHLAAPAIGGDDLLGELLLGAGGDGMGTNRPMAWIVEHLDALNEAFSLDIDTLEYPIRVVDAQPRIELTLEGSLNALSATFLAVYPTPAGNVNFAAGTEGEPLAGSAEASFPYPDSDQPGLYWRRNTARELSAAGLLEGSGFGAADDKGHWTLNDRKAVLRVLASELPEWKRGGVDVIYGERLLHVTRSVERIAPELVLGERQDSGSESWFECEFAFGSPDGATMKESDVRKLLSSGRQETELPGATAIIDGAAVEELNEVLRDLEADQVQPGRYRIAAHHRDYLGATLNIETEPDGERRAAIEAAIGDDLDEILRDYQKEGVIWLCERLLGAGIGGALLADEMGLGKTLQTLAAVRVLREIGGNPFSDRPALVIAPTSLVANWAAEAEKFTPECDVAILHGPGRKALYGEIAGNTLAITSYGVISRDIEELEERGIAFGLTVLDEASFVRNPKTRISKAVHRIDSAARLAVTGTPVENSVRDLWSIFEFALPGCLGSQEDFKRRYETPLGGLSAAPELMKRLQRRVGPHFLRRTKRAVIRDLPDKIEQTLFCDLSDNQRSLYAQLVDTARARVREALGKSGGNQARMTALTALLRLRQLCCDPRLLDSGDRKSADDIESSKLDLLMETLREAREGGHRVLVFSQFVAMLKLIGKQLENDDCEYAYLDGSTSTRDRARAVEKFQQDGADLSVFLISLKAGGYGLNLTAADTVIHYDPWWNPAVEAQATDRAHRIGQERPVTSYKMICRGTVEEKILRLQQSKAAAFASTVGMNDDAPLMRGLNDEEIREVLEI